MSHPSDGVEDAPLHDLDPEAILHRDSRVLLDPQFLAAMQEHDRFTVAAAWDPSETACAAAADANPDLAIAENAIEPPSHNCSDATRTR